MNIPRTVVLFVAICSAAPDLMAQTAQQQGSSHPFTFRQGQAVFITAYHTIEHFVSHGLAPARPTNVMDNHLPAELRVRKDFAKRRVYKLVNRAADADFVFLVVLHDDAAEGVALPSDVYNRFRSNLDMEALREAAYARSTIGPLKVHNLARISDRLVQEFHEKEGRPLANVTTR